MTRIKRRARSEDEYLSPRRHAGAPAPRLDLHQPLSARTIEAVQRQAGNGAATLLVQRAREQEQADADFAAGNAAGYFAGHFLENHLEAASAGAAAEMGKQASSKGARSQGYKKLDERVAGTGWQGGAKKTGTNSMILDYGTQTKQLMRELNVAQAPHLTATPPPAYLHFTTTDRFRVVTYSTNKPGGVIVKAQVKLGARFDGGRYKIDHLGGVA